MMSLSLIAAAAFTAGLFGSAHCVAMCGGMSGLFAVHQGARQTRHALPLALAYNGGRLMSYAAIGGLAGLIGSGLIDLLPDFVLPLRLLAAAVMLAMAVHLVTGSLPIVERLGALLWNHVSPFAGRLMPANTVPRSLGLGLLWGMLPCGLVYSVLVVTLATADPMMGAAGMLSFGLGTMPAMLLTGLGAWRLQSAVGRNRRAAAALLVAMAVATVFMPLSHVLDHDPSVPQHHHSH